MCKLIKYIKSRIIFFHYYFIYFLFHSTIAHLASSRLADFCSPPPCRTPTGLTAQAPASDPTISMTLRVRVYTAARVLLTSACGCERCAECRLQCILCFMYPAPASKPEALHWHRASKY